MCNHQTKGILEEEEDDLSHLILHQKYLCSPEKSSLYWIWLPHLYMVEINSRNTFVALKKKFFLIIEL
ncbi:unnamed protein product [Musa acuminata subsp. malaccensis]|uniref:(wild Malaysian banana) hypothetical protein n=1 Tax=Musa acuminata subsp. malaccensis TaxID=214687 RepID=A0A804IVC7_MUSAM|nr:unnamed protein product [Musa acuminata subsp. malaccensis]